MRKVLACLAVVSVLALSGCGANFSIKQAAQSCDVPSEDGTVSFQNVKRDDAAGFADISCVLYALDVPETVVTRMETTRGIDGVQTATWDDGVDATWSYDEANGFTLTLE